MDAPSSMVPPPETVAAVDLGSNSFHMVIARFLGHDLHILDRLREPVRLASGLDDQRRLTEDTQMRALECLRRFGERLREFPQAHVRAVGTNTLRKATNTLEFRHRAHEALGHPIEIISGLEEARLIYIGVAHSHAPERGRRLVVDIGGGSTELIIGRRLEVLRAHSFYMGCVTYSERFFGSGELTREAFRAAEIAARLELRGTSRALRELGWQAAVGASGTVTSVADMIVAMEGPTAPITLESIKRIRRKMIEQRRVTRLAIPALKPDRVSVIAGGIAILLALFKSLGIDSMTASTGALREGVLYDLAGRLRHDDARDRTIRRLVAQYMVDEEQALRIERTAHHLLAQVAQGWGLAGSWPVQALGWAAHLREIGLSVSYTGYHKHSAYLAEHSDMPGFANDDQQFLAAMIRGHRRKVQRAYFLHLGKERIDSAFRLCLLLRLACRLNRSRSREALPPVRLEGDRKRFVLVFPEGWFDLHPLMRADLAQEATYLGAVGIELVITESSDVPTAPPIGDSVVLPVTHGDDADDRTPTTTSDR